MFISVTKWLEDAMCVCVFKRFFPQQETIAFHRFTLTYLFKNITIFPNSSSCDGFDWRGYTGEVVWPLSCFAIFAEQSFNFDIPYTRIWHPLKMRRYFSNVMDIFQIWWRRGWTESGLVGVLMHASLLAFNPTLSLSRFEEKVTKTPKFRGTLL